MKKRIISSLLLVSIMIITLVFAGCTSTSGEGVLYFSDEDGGTVSESELSFEIQAEAVGKPFKFSIGEGQYQTSYYNLVNLEFVHFQPARGTVNFWDDNDTPDTADDIIINGIINGTFYVDPADYETAFNFEPNEGDLHTFYVGPCRVTAGDYRDNLYLLTICVNQDLNENGSYSYVGFSVYEDDLIQGGKLNPAAVPVSPFFGQVVEGYLTIE